MLYYWGTAITKKIINAVKQKRRATVKKIFLYLSLLLLTLGITLASFSPITYATGADFSVAPILPDNQVGDASYFDILVAPGKTYPLNLQVRNQSDQVKTLHIALNPAHTNLYGQLDYQNKTANKLSGPNLPDLLTGKEEVRLEPNETKIITYQLTLPKEAFSGVLIGAFVIQDTTKKAETDGIKNQFVYQIGLKVREETAKAKAQLTFTNLRIKDEQLYIDVKNNSAGDLSQVAFSGTLSGKMSDQFSQKLSLVPYSKATLILPFTKLQAGDYQLKLNVATSETHYQKNFRLVEQDGQLHLKSKVTPILIASLLLVGLLIGGSIFIFFWQRQKKEA